MGRGDRSALLGISEKISKLMSEQNFLSIYVRMVHLPPLTTEELRLVTLTKFPYLPLTSYHLEGRRLKLKRCRRREEIVYLSRR